MKRLDIRTLRGLTAIFCMILAPLSLLGILEVIDSGGGLWGTVLPVSLSFIFLGCALVLHANDNIPIIYQFSILLLWTMALMLISLVAFAFADPLDSYQYLIILLFGLPSITMAVTAIMLYRHQMEINDPVTLDPFDTPSQIKRMESAEPPPRSLNVPRCLTVLLIILLAYTLIIDLILMYNG